MNRWLLLPLLMQVLLVIVLYVALAIAKARAVRAGAVDERRRALYADAWPVGVQQINNSIGNQFQLPVLFMLQTLLLGQLGEQGWLAVGLGWAFVLSRCCHAWEHTHRNHVPTRRNWFMAGVLIVLLQCVVAGWALLR